MKKVFSLLLAVTMLLALTACGGNKTPSAPVGPDVKDAAELLDKVWGSYAADDRFSIIGGDFDHGNMEKPDVFAIEDGAALDNYLGLPGAMAEKIDDAASLMHMMNANTFTCGAYRVKSSADVKTVCDGIRANLMDRQWMCGFPDKLVVITAGDYVISVFGNEELVDHWKEMTLAAYTMAEVAYDESLL